MNLPPIDLAAMRAAERRATNRRLATYLQHRLGPSLANLHTSAEHLLPAITLSADLLAHSAPVSHQDYSVLILPHILLGVGWWNDPTCQALKPVLAASGLTQHERLALLAERTVDERIRLEQRLPQMHEVTLSVLGWRDATQDPTRLWLHLTRLMTLRGLPDTAHEDAYCLYETDACKHHALPEIRHKRLNGNERLAYQHYGMRLPRPSDDLARLTPLGRSQVLLHILLAIAFGRYFHCNPLFTAWVAPLHPLTCPRERSRAMVDQLTTHLHALTQGQPDA